MSAPDASSRSDPRASLSVVVPTRDRAERLEGCLTSLQASLGTDDEVLVVDSASGDDSTGRVAAEHGLACLRVEQAGASRARNAGWRAARHDYIAFVDDDVRVHVDWADHLVQALAQPNVAFVTGWIGAGNSAQQDPQPSMIDPHPRHLDATTTGAFGASANLGVRRTVLEQVGGFDERLGPATPFAAGEDAELFDRLVRAHFVGRYCPAIRVEHEHERSASARLRLHWNYGKGSGARIRLLWLHDRRRALRTAHELLWRRGVVQAVVRLRGRWAIGVGCSLMRVVGALLGMLRAAVALRSSWPDA